MIKAAFLALLIAAVAMQASAQYGSYRTYCTMKSVIFHNFAENDCAGNFTVYTKPLGGCRIEFFDGRNYSWNARCHYPNATAMQYYNYDGPQCKGESIQTRTYTLHKCFNCPNPECKNPN